jgi:hypothetical protein
MPDTKELVTGQIIFRDANVPLQEDGRRLMMFVGLVAVPPGFVFKNEHQYTLHGQPDGSFVMIHPETECDVTEHGVGRSIGQLLKEPIWRV